MQTDILRVEIFSKNKVSPKSRAMLIKYRTSGKPTFSKPQRVRESKVLHVFQGGTAPATVLAVAAVGLVNVNPHGTLGRFHSLSNSLNRRAIKGDTIQIL